MTEILQTIVAGGLLGMVGQILRIAFGLRKREANQSEQPEFLDQYFNFYDVDRFSTKKMVISLLVSFAVGVVAILYVEIDTSEEIRNAARDGNFYAGIIAAGYTGTDAIEGFYGKFLK